MAGSPWLTRFARLPLRTRLTIAFASVMAAVLITGSGLLYAQFRRDLDAQIDADLHAEAGDVAALVVTGRTPRVVTTSGQRFAQIYAADGRVLASTRAAARVRLLSAARSREAMQRPLRLDRMRLDGIEVRVRGGPVRRSGSRAAAVAVADSLRPRDHALERLRTLLLIGGPLALLLASVAGYELAGAALRSVDRMRSQAEQITEGRLAERLSVPNTNDEVAALAMTLNALLDRIEAAVARERRLVGDASHELRTPLATLRAEVDLALRGERDASELRAALESAAEEAERMTRLADDLLVLARADQGRLPLNPEPIAAADLLERSAARATAAAGAAGRTIVARADTDSGLLLLADPDRTVQALDNLVANALRYGDGTITLAAIANRDSVELHVIDEGAGFPDGLIGHAFERFARGDEARASGSGSGLGLAIVEAIARAHGGRAQARNRPEGGADVWITVPRA